MNSCILVNRSEAVLSAARSALHVVNEPFATTGNAVVRLPAFLVASDLAVVARAVELVDLAVNDGVAVLCTFVVGVGVIEIGRLVGALAVDVPTRAAEVIVGSEGVVVVSLDILDHHVAFRTRSDCVVLAGLEITRIEVGQHVDDLFAICLILEVRLTSCVELSGEVSVSWSSNCESSESGKCESFEVEHWFVCCGWGA